MTGDRVNPRFIVDANVGRLATWLRVMGYDALYLSHIDDNELVRIALREGRTVLTKDTHLATRRVVQKGLLSLVLIAHDDLRSQLQQVVRTLGLTWTGEFSRCIRCNSALRELSKEAASSRVPVYVFQTQQAFMECALCQRVFWRGTHWANMNRDLASLREVNV